MNSEFYNKSDKELLSELYDCLEKTPLIVEVLIRRHYDSLNRYFQLKYSSKTSVADLFHDSIEVFLQNVKKKKVFKSYKTYIKSVFQNIIKNEYRLKSTKYKSNETIDIDNFLFRYVIEKHTQNSEDSIFEDPFEWLQIQLNNDEKQLLLLRYVKEHTTKQIADMLNQTEVSIIKKLSRLKSKIRK